jgi:hypothetical protein
MEFNSGGFIKLYRSVNRHWVWDDPEKLKWWLDILMEVNYEPKKVLIGGQLIQCERGQVLYSLSTWAKRWRVDISKVRRFFYLLKSDGMIETENVGKTTRLTVCNYERYNDYKQEQDTIMTLRRQDKGKEATTTEETKEGKEIKKDSIGASPTPSVFDYDLVKPSIASLEHKEGAKRALNKRFIKPSLEELEAYFKERGSIKYKADAQDFFDHYESVGWVCGRTPMKNWQATVRKWMSRSWDKEKNITPGKIVIRTGRNGGESNMCPGGQIAPGVKLKFP